MVLTIEENKRFNRLFCGLLDYVNKREHLVPGLDFSYCIPEDTQALCVVKDYLWENDYLINDYLRKNQHGLTLIEQDIVAKWKFHNTGMFIYIGKDEGMDIFSDEYDMYYVNGQSKEISSLINGTTRIAAVDTTLLPFEGKIVYDTVLAEYPVDIGRNMANSYMETFGRVKQEGKIVKNEIEFIKTMRKSEEERISMSLDDIDQDESGMVEAMSPERRRALEAEMESELGKIIKNITKKMKGQVIKTKPTTDLEIILNHKTKSELDNSIGARNEYAPSNYRKKQQIEKLKQSFYSKSFLDELFLSCDEDEYELLRKLAKQEIIPLSGEEESCNLMRECKSSEVLIFNFKYEDTYYIVAPEGFSKATEMYFLDDFVTVKEKFNRLVGFAEGMVNIYGVVPIKDFVVEYNHAYGDSIDGEFVKSQLDGEYFWVVCNAEVMDDNLAHYVVTDDMDVYEEICQRNEIQPRKRMDADTVRRYADDLYFEETKEIKALHNFLKKNMEKYGIYENEIDTFITELNKEFRMNVEISEIIAIMEEYIVCPELDDANNVLEYIIDAYNNSVRWGNNGNTSSELRKEELGKMRDEGKTTKIGRNDPCPCGSGKKYKNCCMNRLS